MTLPLVTAEDIESWYQECELIRRSLKERFAHFEPEPEVWHYFADADIRSRDNAWRERQHRLMTGHIQSLRDNSMVSKTSHKFDVRR